eukprot:4591327-Pleurochrysis_carterae.AAC.4
MALGKLRQVIVQGRWRCEGRLEAVRKCRGQGERGNIAHCMSWHGQGGVCAPESTSGGLITSARKLAIF